MITLTKSNKISKHSLVSNFLDSGKMFPKKIDWTRNLLRNNGKFPVIPDVNIIENEKDFKIELAAPGLEKKDFKIEIEKGILTISSEKEEEKKEENKKYKRREFSYNFFRRSFALPENSLYDKIEAKYENGILYISLPKKEEIVSKTAKEIKVA